jgi:hypothetical protein
MNRLDEFIDSNRDAFDTEVPDLRVWAAVETQLPQNAPKAKVVNLQQYFRIAASIALILSVGAGLGVFFTKVDDVKTSAAINAVAPEFQEAERYYTERINEKTAVLTNLKDVDARVSQDLQQVDQVMEELRTALLNAPKGSQEVIVARMISAYKTKIDILEKVLHPDAKINQSLNQKNQNFL